MLVSVLRYRFLDLAVYTDLFTLRCKLFSQKLHCRCVASSEFTSDYNRQTFLTINKRGISWFFGAVAVITQLGFYLFEVNNRNTKSTRARCEMCLKLTVRAPERRQ